MEVITLKTAENVQQLNSPIRAVRGAKNGFPLQKGVNWRGAFVRRVVGNDGSG